MQERRDSDRFSGGEKNREIIACREAKRETKPHGLKAGTAFKRAVDAYEAKRMADFERECQETLSLYREASQLDSASLSVMAITGGGFAAFADRPPEHYR